MALMPNCRTPVPEAMLVRWNWDVNGTSAFNTTHVRVPAGFQPTVANANLWASSIGSLISTSGLINHLTTLTVFKGVSLRDLRTIDQPFVDSTVGTPAGTAAGDILPRNVAEVITLRTNLAGKANRGRIYLPPLDEGSNDAGGRIATTAKAALDAFATGLVAAMAQGGSTFALLHRPVFNMVDCTVLKPGSLTDITSALCRDTRFDSQRRRSGRA